MVEIKKVPANLQDDELTLYLKSMGLERISQGKVRDTWSLKNLLKHNEYLLVIATDRISIFDYVLKPFIPKKGEVLTATTHFWLNNLDGIVHHLIDSEYEEGLNYAYDLRQEYLGKLPIERCLVVKNLTGKMYPAELIFRQHIGGSVFKDYQKTGIVAGQELPLGLPKWAKLDEPLFTPSTKAEVGNDVNVTADDFFNGMEILGLKEEAENFVLMISQAYQMAYCFAEEKGILIMDTKFEGGGGVIADEILTPDSSRFVLKSDWYKALKEGRDPKFLDKQPVRDWGATVPTPFFDANGDQIIGINNLKSDSSEYEKYIEFVQTVEVPENVISDTTKRYTSLIRRLTGMSLKDYQVQKMGVGK